MSKELDKCLMCKNPQCLGCPCGTPVSEVIKLVRTSKIAAAQQALFENNPLSPITCEICPSFRFCQKSCVLSKTPKGGVDFSEIEKNVWSGRWRVKTQVLPRNGKKVLVIGSGPAGLSSAFYLSKRGFSVEVHEERGRFGGMLRYGIPDFRLDKTKINKIIRILRNMGVIIKSRSAVDLNNLQQIKTDGGFHGIIVATGAWASKKLKIEGEDLPNVKTAIQFLTTHHSAFHTPQIIVIGGGNVAVDCALVAAKKGACVKLCYRRGEADMKAYPHEINLAKNGGVVFEFNIAPKRITKDGVFFERGGEETFEKADLVVVAVGQSSDLKKSEIEGIYYIGDCITGTATVVEAVAAAKDISLRFTE